MVQVRSLAAITARCSSSYPGLNASLTVTTGVIMGVIVTVAALALPVNLLSKFTLKGDPA